MPASTSCWFMKYQENSKTPRKRLISTGTTIVASTRTDPSRSLHRLLTTENTTRPLTPLRSIPPAAASRTAAAPARAARHSRRRANAAQGGSLRGRNPTLLGPGLVALDGPHHPRAIAGNARVVNVGRPRVDGLDRLIGGHGIAGGRTDGHDPLLVWVEGAVERVERRAAGQERGAAQHRKYPG